MPRTAAAALEQRGDDPNAVVEVLQRFGLSSPEQLESLLARIPLDMADSFADVFLIGTVLVGCCLIPALFLPRKPAENPVDPAAMMH